MDLCNKLHSTELLYLEYAEVLKMSSELLNPKVELVVKQTCSFSAVVKILSFGTVKPP